MVGSRETRCLRRINACSQDGTYRAWRRASYIFGEELENAIRASVCVRRRTVLTVEAQVRLHPRTFQMERLMWSRRNKRD